VGAKASSFFAYVIAAILTKRVHRW